MRALIAIAVAVTIAGVAATFLIPSHTTHGVSAVAGAGPDAGAGAAPGTGPDTVLAPDQTRIAGTVTSARVTGVPSGPLGLPLTVTVPNRGQGQANISGVRIDGRTVGVSWDGGQPLPLSGTGALDLGRTTFDAGADGITWHLDGAPRVLRPGRYTTGSTVAVGGSGLARAVDQATFVVPPGTTGALVSAGDAQVHPPAAPVSATGPGGVMLTGTLTASTAAGRRTAHQIRLDAGAFELTLTPVGGAGGYRVTALLQGAVTAS